MLKLRKSEPAEPLAVSMTAVRTGDRLLIIGCGELKVIEQIAGRPGISGRACAVDATNERTARAREAAEREGALLDVETAPMTSLPFENESFDVAVVNYVLPEIPPNQRVAVLTEVARVLRGGGRCIVVQAGRRTGLAGLFRGSPPMRSDEIETLLQSAGFRAVRTLTEREGQVFVEGGRRS
jgi:ubiquinone/menaquinone biosynthesis C-methylase UbiE